jgi:hypothetical protein
MYPAQALFDGLYTVDDLPDTLVVIGSAGTPYSCLVTKTNGSSPYYSGTCEGQQSRIIINDDNAWEFQTLSPEDGWLEPQDRSPNACLIFDPNLEGNAYVEDQFADTYTVSGPISGTVTRESICVWRGERLRLTNFGFQWKVNGNNKSGFQNTPVGSYAGGFTVS